MFDQRPASLAQKSTEKWTKENIFFKCFVIIYEEEKSDTNLTLEQGKMSLFLLP